ncbi:hypothetical protein [Streptomyces pseudovenezuelae]|uniref:hypothetical protein n=1 Tax=Streptomyces pseudovenezuelae TaxID=67350 RepID=UPI0036E50EAA
MDNTTAPTRPNRQTLTTANAATWAQHDRANSLAALFEAIRAWRLMQPHTDAVEFAPLDAILDAVALGGSAALLRLQQPANVTEACEAHREVMAARARAFEALRLVWDQIENASIRAIVAAPETR